MKTIRMFIITFPILLGYVSGYSQSINFDVKGNVEVLIIDPLGRKYGIDKQTGIEYREIPNVGLGSANIGILNPETGEIGVDSAMMDLVDGDLNPALDGEYQFFLQGNANANTYISASIYFPNSGEFVNLVKGSIVDTNMAAQIDLFYVSNNKEQTYIKKQINQEYLVRCLYAMRTRGWILDDATRDKYISMVNSYYSFINSNNLTQARLALDSLQQALKADSLSHSVNNQLLSYLSGDIAQVKSELPPPTEESIAVLLDTLINRMNTAFSQNWLGNQNFVKELTNHLENAKKHLNKKDSLKCAQEVEKFQSKVNKEYKEASTKDNRFVTVEGWKFLYFNAQYIIKRLVKLPAKSQSTLLQQIAELNAELTRQSNKKNVGGVLLVKSLTFLADQAKKQLQKPLPSTNDSATAALSVAAFQLFVDEVWELTDAISGKNPKGAGKKLPTLYVYDEAYIQLHYRAKYILEALPAPRTLIDMKSVQMDDDVRKEFDAMQRMSKEQ